MSEEGGYLMYCDPLVQEQRCGGMPGVVEADAANPGFVAQVAPPMRDVVGADPFLLHVYEDGAVDGCFRLEFESASLEALAVKMPAKGIERDFIDLYSADLTSLRPVEYVGAGPVVNEGLLERDCLGVEIDMPPIEA